jgi:hypothetical protein
VSLNEVATLVGLKDKNISLPEKKVTACMASRAVLWLRLLAAGLSLRRPYVRSRVSPCGFSVRHTGIGTVFFIEFSQYHSTMAPYSNITWEMNNRSLVAEVQGHSLSPST